MDKVRVSDSRYKDSNCIGIGLLGCGTMGAEVAVAISSGEIQNAGLLAVFDEDISRANSLSKTLTAEPISCRTVDELLAVEGVSLIVECASPAAISSHGANVLSAGRSLFVLSSGALADTELFGRLISIAHVNGCEIIVPSGALGGIDALRAVKNFLEELTLTSTKRPEAFSGAPGFAKWENVEITESTVLFEGPAIDAVPLFPSNINVAATLSLVGLGPEKTTVKVVADPLSVGNVHEIYARGDFGEFNFRLINQPHFRNLKTSHLAVLSAIETLRTYCGSGPRIGT